MPRILNLVAALLLLLHGLIHLMGTAVYLNHVSLPNFSYKTTLLGGRLDLGDVGIRVFGALWLPAAFGFVLVALALAFGWSWWRTSLQAATLFSLLLTTLDWNVAFLGAMIDWAILLLILLVPHLLSRLNPGRI